MNTKTKRVFKVGDRVRLLTDKWVGYGLNKGDIATISYAPPRGSGSYHIRNANTGQTTAVNSGDIGEAVQTREEILNAIKEQQKEIENYQSKLEWMDITGNEVYDETEFKVWNTLKTLDSKASNTDKAKIIANLIKNG